MPPHKRQKLSDDEESEHNEAVTGSEAEAEESNSEGFSSGNESEGDSDDLETLKPQKSRQTLKRKVRATRASAFGQTLQFLLATETPSELPLSLKPSLARKRNDEKLELRAKKVLDVERKEREEKGRMKDVIGGWGGESERALRKVAQRGVVKLFNVIQQSQTDASVAVEKTKAARGSGKPSLPAPTIPHKTKGKAKAKEKDNVLGRGKEVDKNDFFEMIRSGGIVSKA